MPYCHRSGSLAVKRYDDPLAYPMRSNHRLPSEGNTEYPLTYTTHKEGTMMNHSLTTSIMIHSLTLCGHKDDSFTYSLNAKNDALTYPLTSRIDALTLNHFLTFSLQVRGWKLTYPLSEQGWAWWSLCLPVSEPKEAGCCIWWNITKKIAYSMLTVYTLK